MQRRLTASQASKFRKLRQLRKDFVKIEKQIETLRDELRDELEAGSYTDPKSGHDLAIIAGSSPCEVTKEDAEETERKLSTLEVIKALGLREDLIKESPIMKKVAEYNREHPNVIPLTFRDYKQVKTSLKK